MVNQDFFIEILYQLHLVEQLLSKETSIAKRCKYEGMKEALLYVLSILQ